MELDQRIVLERFQGEGDAPAFRIDVQDLSGDFLADGDDVGGVVDRSPRQFGNVDHRGEAADLHEGHAEAGPVQFVLGGDVQGSFSSWS
nr:hypothetical protein [Actinomadura nitritigenes]